MIFIKLSASQSQIFVEKANISIHTNDVNKINVIVNITCT